MKNESDCISKELDALEKEGVGINRPDVGIMLLTNKEAKQHKKRLSKKFTVHKTIFGNLVYLKRPYEK